MKSPEEFAGPAQVKRLSLRSFCRLWDCDAAWTPIHNKDGSECWSCIHVWEPLETAAPESAVPYCCYGNTVVFYTDRTWAAKHDQIEHTSFGGFSPDLIFVNRIWWEAGTGRVVWHDGRWFMRYLAWRNGRYAYMMNHGFPAYQDPEIAYRWRYHLKQALRKFWKNVEPILTGQTVGKIVSKGDR